MIGDLSCIVKEVDIHYDSQLLYYKEEKICFYK